MANSYFIVEAYKGLGTAFWIELFLDENEKATLPEEKIRNHLEATITDFGARYSRFSESSFLSQLNREKSVPYDHDLAVMVQCAQKVSQATNNTFSLFIKEKLEAKGYGTQNNTAVHDDSEEASDVVIDSSSIKLLGNRGIDLGGVGKGHLIDKLASILRDDYHLSYFLINGGGDIYVTSNHGKDVELLLEHPINEGDYINKIVLKNKAFCASSSFKRSWKKGSTQVNHFIADKEIWAASYVIGNTATMADMYATVFCILADTPSSLERFAKDNTLDYIVINERGTMTKSDNFPPFLEG